jgi:hypothetical protein
MKMKKYFALLILLVLAQLQPQVIAKVVINNGQLSST